jgi:hypothetical protein
MAIALYTVWSKDKYEPDLYEIFTDSEAAEEYAARVNGKVLPWEAYDSVKECDAAQVF